MQMHRSSYRYVGQQEPVDTAYGEVDEDVRAIAIHWLSQALRELRSAASTICLIARNG